jgi:Insertion element 4 transposase N-terminal
MYRVRYLEQNDKLGEQVRLWMFETIYAPDLLRECAEQSPRRRQKRRRLRHFTALSVLWFVLAMVQWSRLAQGREWEKLTHWLQERFADAPQEPAGASALSYQRELLGVEPVQQLFEQGTHVLCAQQTAGAWYQGHRLMALDGSLFPLPDTPTNEQAADAHQQSGRQRGLSAGAGGARNGVRQPCQHRAADRAL